MKSIEFRNIDPFYYEIEFENDFIKGSNSTNKNKTGIQSIKFEQIENSNILYNVNRNNKIQQNYIWNMEKTLIQNKKFIDIINLKQKVIFESLKIFQTFKNILCMIKFSIGDLIQQMHKVINCKLQIRNNRLFFSFHLILINIILLSLFSITSAVNYEACATSTCCNGYYHCSGYGCSSQTYNCDDYIRSCSYMGCSAVPCIYGTCSSMGYCSRCLTCACTQTTYGSFEGSCCNTWYCGPTGNRYEHSDDRVCSGRRKNQEPPNNGRGLCVNPNECECSQCYGHGYYTSAGINSVCGFFRCNNKDANDPNVCSGHGRCGCAPNPNEQTVLPYPSYEPCLTPCDCTCNKDSFGKPLYMGDNCQYPVCDNIASNDITVCNGRGSCNTPGTCSCANTGDWGYSGSFCEETKCGGKVSPNSCGGPNKGECKRIEGTYTNACSCYGGYTGSECQYYVCNGVNGDDPNVCNGGVSGIPARGTCTGVNSCTCGSLWTGSNCEIHKCNGLPYTNPNACGGHGTCVTDEIAISCICDSGWTYDVDTVSICTTPVCFGKDILFFGPSLVCSGHGTCDGPDTCTCLSGWSGPECSDPICYDVPATDSNVCSSNGICSDIDTCTCNLGFDGNNCQYHLCNSIAHNLPSVCSGHGVCSGVDNCICEPGYVNNYCDEYTCYGILSNQASVCNGHGLCSAVNSCVCDEGFGGEECQYTICYSLLSNDSSICSGHGSCIGHDQCSCDTGYTELDCSYTLCYGISGLSSSVCNGKGNCISPDLCDCDEGYTGEQCEKIICFDKTSSDEDVCSSHGTCIDPNTCNCDSGYGGTKCQYSICFSLFDNDPNVCSSHGSCTAPDTCACLTGYPGDNCQYFQCNNILSSNPSVCSGHGDCIEYNHCNCEFGWTGNIGQFGQKIDCNIWTCNDTRYDLARVCSSHGSCIGVNQCKCNTYYSGQNCEFHYCTGILSNDPSVCLSRGECSSPNQCDCTTPGFTGNNCEYPICYGIPSNDSTVCSGNGFCFSPDQCSYCSSGYTGEICKTSICYDIAADDPNVCNGHGTCTFPNTCKCNRGYSGDQCDVFSCFDIASSDSFVCSGRGQCLQHDYCVCDDEYKWGGSNCELPKCFGILNSSVEVCSGNGICSIPNVCKCSNGWKGESCSLFYCHGQSNCSNHGTCISGDTCSCNDYWLGSDCSVWTCNNISKFSTDVCNGHGICSTFNSCQCQDKWFGENCELFTCFQIGLNDTKVCNSHGKCSAIDQCSCISGYIGKNCSIPLSSCRYEDSSQKFAIAKDCSTCTIASSIDNCISIINPTFMIEKGKIYGVFIIPNRQIDIISCSKVVTQASLSRLGIDPICQWLPGTNHFEIIFGEGASFSNGETIQINLLPFEDENVVSEYAFVVARTTWENSESKSISQTNSLVGIIAIASSSAVLFILLTIIVISILICCIISSIFLKRKYLNQLNKVENDTFVKNPIQSSENERSNSSGSFILHDSNLSEDGSVGSNLGNNTFSLRENIDSPNNDKEYISSYLKWLSSRQNESNLKDINTENEFSNLRGLKRIESNDPRNRNNHSSIEIDNRDISHPNSLSNWFSRAEDNHNENDSIETSFQDSAQSKWIRHEARRKVERESMLNSYWKNFTNEIQTDEWNSKRTNIVVSQIKDPFSKEKNE